ncbi:MAG: anti-anti-sigma factor, partial [Acidobacteria bacterium]|nr:anti-anti-sigma factor [Acidobacteriota bacterium]
MTQTQVVNSVGISRLIEIIEICDQKAGGVVFCTTRPILMKTFKIMGLLTKARLVARVEDLATLD